MQAAFFDLDKTVIARSSGLVLGRNFYREGLISRRTLLRGIVAQFIYLLVGADADKMEKMRRKALELTRGWERAKVVAIVEEVLGEAITPIIYREAVDLIEEHKAQRRQVYLVSSSPEEVVAPMGGLLGVTGVIASVGKVDDEDRYTGELDFYCYGIHKAEAMRELAAREGIDLAESFAYSDSATDLPMLEAVGHPVATNPDRALRKLAQERGWEVLTFSKPVTLRKKISDLAPSPRTTLVSSGVALGLAAGVAGYMWLRRRGRPNAPFALPFRRD